MPISIRFLPRTLKVAEQLVIQNGDNIVRSLMVIELIDREGRNLLQYSDQFSALVQLTNTNLAMIEQTH